MKTQEVKVVVPQLSTVHVSLEDLIVTHYQTQLSLIVALKDMQYDLFDENLDEVFAVEKTFSFDSADVLRSANRASSVAIKRTSETHMQTFIKNEVDTVLQSAISEYADRANYVEAVVDEVVVVTKSKEAISVEDYAELIRYKSAVLH